MSQAQAIDDVAEGLESELADDAKVLTDVEDRFVYANEKYFDEYHVEVDEDAMPDLVVRVTSNADAEAAKRVLEENGYRATFRDKWAPENVDPAEAIGLIDSTDTFHPPVELDAQARPMDLSDLRLEHPHDADVYSQDWFERSQVSKGYCPINQTVYGDVETYSAKGRLMVSRQLTTDDDSPIEHSKKASQILFSCASCGNCFRPTTDGLEGMWQGLIGGKQEIIEDRDGVIPKSIMDMLENTFLHGNPYGESRTARAKWARDVDVEVPVVEPGDSVDVLFFVGCSPSYDDRNKELAKSLARIFDTLDLDWAILGENESCAGNHQRVLGEEGLFEEMVEQNADAMEDVDFDTLVTADPHSYHSFKNEYSNHGVDLDPMHYTEFLVDQLDLDELSSDREEPKTVTYHDSCYLETHNGVTAEPRHLLEALPGYEFVDIDSRAMCCGGGGGRMWFEDDYVETRPAEPVVDSAMDVEADVLALACPFCVTNFEDARKTMDLEEEFVVKDISELVVEALNDVAE